MPGPGEPRRQPVPAPGAAGGDDGPLGAGGTADPGAGVTARAEEADAQDSRDEAHAVPARPSKRLEIVSAAIALVGFVGVALLAGGIEVRAETGGVDPRWWPRLLGMVGAALAVPLLVIAVVRRPAERDDLQDATRQGRLRTLVAVALSALYIGAWPLLGFLVTTLVFLVAMTYVFGGRGWKTLIVFPAALTAFIYLLFDTTLQVPL